MRERDENKLPETIDGKKRKRKKETDDMQWRREMAAVRESAD